jgi:hypothetical protein
MLVELDRVGVFRPLEIGEEAERILPAGERRKRLQTLFERSTSFGAADAQRGCWRTFLRNFLLT